MVEVGASSTKTKSEPQWALRLSCLRAFPPSPQGVDTALPVRGPLFSLLLPGSSAPQGPFCDVSSLFILLYGCL